jgi:hypothetical protein
MKNSNTLINQSISSEYSTIGEVSIFAHDNMTDFEKFLMAKAYITFLKKELEVSNEHITALNDKFHKKLKDEIAKKDIIINDLIQKNNKLISLTPSERKNVKKEEMFRLVSNQLDNAKETIAKLKKEKDDLLCTIVQLRK